MKNNIKLIIKKNIIDKILYWSLHENEIIKIFIGHTD